MRHALYIVGEPGVGKSTLVEHLTRGLLPTQYRRPLDHIEYEGPGPTVVELGARRPGRFGGTDALAMSAINVAEPWVLGRLAEGWTPGPLLLAEGDRLACDRFLTALLDGGYELIVAHLFAPPEVAERRRHERGSAQNEAWVKGRRTKVENLVQRWAPWVRTLDAMEEPARLATTLADISPVARALKGERP